MRLRLPLLGSFFFCCISRLRLCPFPRFLLFWHIPVLWLLGFSKDMLRFFRRVRRIFSRAWNHARCKTSTRSLIFLAKCHLNKIACPDAFILCEIRKRKPRAAESNLAVYILLLCMSLGACFHVFGFLLNSKESQSRRESVTTGSLPGIPSSGSYSSCILQFCCFAEYSNSLFIFLYETGCLGQALCNIPKLVFSLFRYRLQIFKITFIYILRGVI